MIDAFYFLIPIFFILSFSTWMMRVTLGNRPRKAVVKKKNHYAPLIATDADRPAIYGFVPFSIRNAA